MRDRGDQQADTQEGDEEADRGEKESSMRPIGNPLVNELAQLRPVKYQHHQRRGYADEDQQDPNSGNMHSLEISWLADNRRRSTGGHILVARRSAF